MSEGRAALEARLGHAFSDGSLLEAALTHRSARGPHNERLEFLGDAVLGLVVAEAVYQRFPTVDEGDLSRRRAALVRAETLAEVGAELGLGEWLSLGPGEMKSGGYRRGSILGDAVEALIGATYLDAGFGPARALVLRVLATRLDDPPDPAALKDAKTRLQEQLQARQLDRPVYELMETTGAAHRQTFRVACDVHALGLHAEGSGPSRRRAEQVAAEALLAALDQTS